MSSTWSRFFNRKSKCRFESLPEEIIVDEIISLLHVRDILRLRRVNKTMCMLTKKPAVWKRLLPHIPNIQQPLAPLPPTKMYNLKNLTSHDMETIVTRAFTYDKRWKDGVIRPWSISGGLTHYNILEMVLLPGGHFLVSSVLTAIGDYGIAIWSMDHPATQRLAPLIFRNTEVKAYGIKARYMKVLGEKGISIAFLRKWHKVKEDSRFVPETFELGGKGDQEDPYMPLKYECTTLRVSLETIELLTDRNVKPKTSEFMRRIVAARASLGTDGDLFNVVSRIRTATQLGGVSLDVINGDPHVCVLKRPNTIVFERLRDCVRSVLECRPTETASPHSTWNFRVLPDQNEVLVIRNVEKVAPEMETDWIIIQLFRIPTEGQTINVSPTSGTFVIRKAYLNVQVSEIQRTLPFEDDDSVTPSLMENKPPQPLSIFCRTPYGFAHHSIWPEETQLPPSSSHTPHQSLHSTGENTPIRKRRHFIYDVQKVKHTFFCCNGCKSLSPDLEESSKDHSGKEIQMRFLPGASRAVILEIPTNYKSTRPPILRCYGFQYVGEDMTSHLDNANAEADEAEVEQALIAGHGSSDQIAARIIHPTLDIPVRELEDTSIGNIRLHEDVTKEVVKGVSAVCFDEDTGRLAFATPRDKKLHVCDFSFVRFRDEDDNAITKMMDDAIKIHDQSSAE
ncbi:hypothetical protein DFH11DRAFT_1539026 [Phellopilus nigrolimitatus]|nr:hypothetical protein DFH11DRAFT_1539026 [Phellopilus nigrolimitatus]